MGPGEFWSRPAAFAVSAVCLLVSPTEARAQCACLDELVPITQYVERTEFAVWGAVESVSENESGTWATLRVERVYHGEPPTTVEVRSLSGPCAVAFEADENFVVLAQRDDDGYFTSRCMHTAASPHEPPRLGSPGRRDMAAFEREMEPALSAALDATMRDCQEPDGLEQVHFRATVYGDGTLDLERVLAGRERGFADCFRRGLFTHLQFPRFEDKPVTLAHGLYLGPERRRQFAYKEAQFGGPASFWLMRPMLGEPQRHPPGAQRDAANDLIRQMKETRATGPMCEADGYAAGRGVLNALRSSLSPQGLEIAPADAAPASRALLDCALRRDEIDGALETAREFAALETAGESVADLIEALEWAQPLLAKHGLPLTADGRRYKEDAASRRGLLSWARTLNRGQKRTLDWVDAPILLEALASAVQHPAASDAEREFAALAYLRAGLLRPEHREAYEVLAKEANPAGVPAQAAQMEEAFAKVAARLERAAPPETPTDKAAPTESETSFWWWLGSLAAVLVTLAGARALRRR